MTTPCELVQIEYQGNGTLSVFAFPFPYDFKTEVKVALWNNTNKKHEDILTTDATYPWEVNDANPTAVTFTGTVPPAPPASDVNEDPIYNVRIYRVTDMTDIRSVFNQGSAIRATDLNKNFEQLRYAIQEGKCQIPDKLLEYLDEYYWNNYSDVIYSTETWPNNDTTIATTAKIDDMIDEAITGDIAVDSTGLTFTNDGDGTITLGIGANSVDIDRIKTDDVVETSAYASTWSNEDDKIATVGAIAKRHDLTISTSAPTTTQLGRLWYNNTIGVNSLNMWDGSGWKVVTSGTPYIPQGTTIVRYVDKVNGSDASDVTGFLPQSPLKSIKRALTLVNASASGDGTLIVIAPGVYQEELPLRIEKNNVSIIGTSLRSCFVHPTVATETNSMFEVTSGSYITNLTLLGLKVPTSDQGSRNNSLDNDATYGLPSNQPFAVRFRTDTQPIILKSPYIQNCTHFSDAHFDNSNFDPNTFQSTDAQTYSAVAGDQTSAPCGGGLLIDGAAVSSSSPIRSMVVDAFTQICLDGPGVLVTNNGYAQLVSFFGTFTHYHAKAKNGGQINLSNCVSDFGRYGLIADGKSPAAIATATISSPSVGAGSGSTTVTIGALTQGTFHGSVSQPLNHMMITIDGVDYGVVSSVANGSGWDVTLTSGLTGNITSTSAAFALRSYISTGGHTFEFVGVGTNYGDHPDEGGVPIEANQVIELNGGKVWQSSTDHVGKFKAGNVLVVDQVSETVDLKDTTVTGNITVTGTVDGRDVATDGTKLDGIESGATADQTAAEIRTLVETATDSNVFTDADHTKLNGIATGATNYANSDVDAHLNQSTAGSGEVLSWNGSDYDWVAQSGGGGGATAIDDLSDVDTSTVAPTDGQALVWDNAASQWEPGTVASSSSSIQTATDFQLQPATGTTPITRTGNTGRSSNVLSGEIGLSIQSSGYSYWSTNPGGLSGTILDYLVNTASFPIDVDISGTTYSITGIQDNSTSSTPNVRLDHTSGISLTNGVSYTLSLASAPTLPLQNGDFLQWVAADSKFKPTQPSSTTVDSVNGEAGVVSLGIQDMDDFELKPGTFPYWATKAATTAPSAGEWFANGSNIMRANPVDSNGTDWTTEMTALGTTGTFWYSTDAINWTQTTNTGGQSSLPTWFQFGLSPFNVTSHAGGIYISFSDPASTPGAPLQEGDILQWVAADSKFKPQLQPAITSVNTQTGAVSLGIEDLDDFALQPASGLPYNTWSSDNTPSAGEWHINNSFFYLPKVDSNGINQSTNFRALDGTTTLVITQGATNYNVTNATLIGDELDGTHQRALISSGPSAGGNIATIDSSITKSGSISVTCSSFNLAGLPLANGDILQYVSADSKFKPIQLSSGIANVVEDTTPQLGGPLDVQAQEINTSTTNGNIKLTPDGTGVVEIRGNTGNDAAIQLNCEQNTHGVKIKSPPHSAAASYTLTLPDDTGTSNQLLKTDGSGNLSWANDSAGVATVDTTSLNTNFAINPDSGTMLIDQITDNRTYTDDMDSGESVTMMVNRNSALFSITWPTIKWVGGSQPILPTGSTAYAIITVWKAGTTLFGSYGGDAS